MSGSTRGLLAFVAILSLIAAARGEAADVPYLTGRVVDNAEILSAEARARVTAALKQHEDVTSNQIVVLTGPVHVEVASHQSQVASQESTVDSHGLRQPTDDLRLTTDDR